ncbi:MAG: hypothetical protein KAS32_15070 [Candidatus Peribacteraceae bacterium]|nr:hypothetical protein [Candidatus Peribacteraceae bacterium]
MYKVESKYKNPDKHIEHLKNRVFQEHTFAEHNWLRYINVQGERLFEYSDNQFETVTLADRDLGDLKVRQKVALHGTVEEVNEKVQCYENGENGSSIKIRVTEFRTYEKEA